MLFFLLIVFVLFCASIKKSAHKSILKQLIMKLYLVSFFTLMSTLGFAQKSVIASYYHSKFEGRTTSSGSIYRADNLTCAHKTLPFGTRLKVENPDNNNFVIVEVTDRGPFIKGREIDLSYAAANRLGIVEEGVAVVKMTNLQKFKFTPPLIFDINKAICLKEEKPHSAYAKIYNLENILYSQR